MIENAAVTNRKTYAIFSHGNTEPTEEYRCERLSPWVPWLPCAKKRLGHHLYGTTAAGRAAAFWTIHGSIRSPRVSRSARSPGDPLTFDTSR
jgi:hypothetical protein